MSIHKKLNSIHLKRLLFLSLLFISICCFSQSRIIGNPIKIKNIEVAQFDFPNKMNWASANKACKGLGKGWRLPTKPELKTLFKNKAKIGGFKGDIYWSSWGYSGNRAWNQIFLKGKYYGRQGVSKKPQTLSVRAVRTL
jgi:hypothetical protein